MRTHKNNPGYFLEQFLDSSLPFKNIWTEDDAIPFVGFWVVIKTRSTYHNPFYYDTEWPVFVGHIHFEIDDTVMNIKVHRILTNGPAMNCLLLPWKLNCLRYYESLMIRNLTDTENNSIRDYLASLNP